MALVDRNKGAFTSKPDSVQASNKGAFMCPAESLQASRVLRRSGKRSVDSEG
jgi:hypothetical protein